MEAKFILSKKAVLEQYNKLKELGADMRGWKCPAGINRLLLFPPCA
ncbi:hypothetical protein HYT26_01275 [Candidatus Pacearchaeota archaeon]|nr:hypothetical protein [Candidatus Pacearchaeota archaeon]